MPTPSNAPDPLSSISQLFFPFPFSSCPDPEEPQEASPPLYMDGDRNESAEHADGSGSAVNMDEDSASQSSSGPSRSATSSPWPAPDQHQEDATPREGNVQRQRMYSPATALRRMERDQGGAENRMRVSGDESEDDLDRKQTDSDEDMVASGSESGAVMDSGEWGQARTDDGRSRRRRHSVKGRLPPTGDSADAAVGPGSSHDWTEGTNSFADSGLGGLGYEFAQKRIIPVSLASTLRPGSRFAGQQQSERSRYDVQVEIKHVDVRESFLCGYLRIQGLTDDHPSLTTFFEGEIIGSKYGFVTQHPSWGATETVDYNHWSKFPAFKTYKKQARGEGGLSGHHQLDKIHIDKMQQRENVFMRWKEHFLVPDHRVKTINGASFEGFYYICFNQVKGEFSGIYFHCKSEKFQQLDLKHVEDRGCFGALELR